MNEKRLTSPIWKIDRESLQELLNKSNSVVEVLETLKLDGYSGNHRTLLKRVEEDGLCLENLKINRKIVQTNHLKTLHSRVEIPLEDLLLQDGHPISSKSLKDKLFKKGLLPEKCAKCGVGTFWMGERLGLQLDHINGNNKDNRIQNLQILCPNCHSQTETFAGRNSSKTKNKRCLVCNNFLSNGAIKYCSSKCNGERQKGVERLSSRKVRERPSREQLLEDLATSSYVATGKKYGVSDNAIRKWLKWETTI